MNGDAGSTVFSELQSTSREYGESLARMSSPWLPGRLNVIGLDAPGLTMLRVGPGAIPPVNPSRQSSCVSKASSLSSRFVVPCTALMPSPRRANVAQAVHVSLSAQRLGRSDDPVAGVDEPGITALHLQPVGDVLDGAEVPAAVPGPVQVRVEPVLVDQVPVQIPEGRRPAVAEAVREGERRPVEPAAGLDAVVRERLDLHVPGVRPRPDARAVPVVLEEGVRPHPTRLVRVVERRVEQHRDGVVVAPALARLLVAGEAVDRRAAREAVRDPVPVLVDDDPVLEVPVPDAGMVRVLAHRSRGGAGGDRVANGRAVGRGDARDGNVRHGGGLRSRSGRRPSFRRRTSTPSPRSPRPAWPCRRSGNRCCRR